MFLTHSRGQWPSTFKLAIVTWSMLAVLSWCCCAAMGGELAMDFTGIGGSLFSANSTFGWSFEVHQPVRVDRLGFFDGFIEGGPGLRADHQVRIWHDDASRQLVTATVIDNNSTPAASTAQDGQWLFNDITPVVLRRGNYVIGADDPPCSGADCDRIRFFGTATLMPQISLGIPRNASPAGFPQANSEPRADGYFGPTFWATALPGPDFNFDDRVSCLDVDALVAEIVAGKDSPAFDMNGDESVNNEDLQEWLVQAGARNLGSGNPYLPGDANLDGAVDGADFITWNSNKFESLPAWCDGDFNADGTVDGQDFITWNVHKFQSADMAAVPEPALLWGWMVAAALLWVRQL